MMLHNCIIIKSIGTNLIASKVIRVLVNPSSRPRIPSKMILAIVGHLFPPSTHLNHIILNNESLLKFQSQSVG
jgi:hypothetical protein